MGVTEWYLPQTAASTDYAGGPFWRNPERVYNTDPDFYADVDVGPTSGIETTDRLTATNFAPSFPEGALLRGVEARVRVGILADTNTHVKDHLAEFRVASGSVLVVTSTAEWGIYEMRTYGGATSLPSINGVPLTIEEVEDAGFGFSIIGENLLDTTDTIRVFTIEMRFHYELSLTSNANLPGLTGKAHHRVN